MAFLELHTVRQDYGSQFEIAVSLLYHELLTPGDIAVDGGANTGVHALPMASLLDSGHLHCFEPNTQMVTILKRDLAERGIDGRCSVYAQAIGHETGVVEFLIDDAHPAVSHIRFEPLSSLRAVQVPVVTLDDTLRTSPISFIKLDLEGAEFRALQGANRILARDRPFVVFENSRAWAAECYGYAAHDFFEYFDRLDYRIFDIHGVELTPTNWLEEDFSYELIAAHVDDPRLPKALSLLDGFWVSIHRRPELQSWRECVSKIDNPREYLNQTGCVF